MLCYRTDQIVQSFLNSTASIKGQISPSPSTPIVIILHNLPDQLAIFSPRRFEQKNPIACFLSEGDSQQFL